MNRGVEVEGNLEQKITKETKGGEELLETGFRTFFVIFVTFCSICLERDQGELNGV